jgi:hypothetical protein
MGPAAPLNSSKGARKTRFPNQAEPDTITTVALPTDPAKSREDTLARRRAAEEEALLREVDEAVRQDDLLSFGQRYGRQLAIAAVLLVVGFGGYLLWQSRQQAALERESEAVITALDQAQAGNIAAAGTAASALLQEAAAGPQASARFIAAGAALREGDNERAVRELGTLASDSSAPRALRDLATLQMVALQYDGMDKGQVIARLAPLARPGNPWFGSAGELVAMAYLDQGKRGEAGALFSRVANDPGVPEPIRSRARQMAGVLGVDAIPDVDKFLAQQRARQQGAEAAPNAPAPQPGA